MRTIVERRAAVCQTLALCALLSLAGPASLAQTERHTRLAVPRMVAEAEPVLVLQTGHGRGSNFAEPTALTFSPDGRQLASGGDDGRVIIWDLGQRRAACVFAGHAAGIASVSFSPAGDKLGVGLRRGSGIALWDTRSKLKQVIASASGGSVCFSPSGAMIAGEAGGRSVAVWRLADGRRTALLGDPGLTAVPDWVSDVGFLPGGDRIVIARRMGLEAFDVASSRRVWAVDLHAAPENYPVFTSVDRGLSSIDISPDGRTLVVGSEYGRVICLDSATGGEVWAFTMLGSFGDVSYSADGRTVAASFREVQPNTQLGGGSFGRNSVVLLDARTGRLTGSIPFGSLNIGRIRCSPRGGDLAVAMPDGGVEVWDIGTASRRFKLESEVAEVRDIALFPDGQRVCLALSTGSVNVIRLTDGAVWRTIRNEAVGALSVDVAGDGETLAVALRSADQSKPTIVRALDVATGEPLWSLSLAAGGPEWLCFLPQDAAVALLERESLHFLDASTGRVVSTVSAKTVRDVSRSLPPNRKPVSGWGYRKQILAWHPGGETVAVTKGYSPELILRDRQSWLEESSLTARESGFPFINCVVFSPNGTALAAGSDDGKVRVWRAPFSDPHQVIPGDTGSVSALRFAQDGRLLLVGTSDGTLRVFDAADFRLRASIVNLRATGEWITTTPSGYYDCSLGADSLVVWRIGDNIYPFDQFAEKYHRPDLVRRALAGEDISDAPPLDGTQIPPNLEFASPEYGAEVAGESVAVEIDVAGVYPIKRLELAVNGRGVPAEVARSLEIESPTEKVRTFRVSVPLPPNEPTVRLRAIVYDTELLRSRPAELYLRRSGLEARPGKVYVVSVGVSKYQTAAWNTLQYADDDARAFAEAFAKQQGNQYAGVEQRVLTDEEATVSNLKFALRWLKDAATEGDVAVVFLAGHGIEQAGDYYFLCHDTKESNLGNTSLPWQDFVGLLREVRAKRLLLFVDTCHSGFVTGWRTTDDIIDRLNRKAGVLVFTGSRGEEASVERADWGHGAFTKSLLEGLDGQADSGGDDEITLQELNDFVTSRVEDLTDNRQHPYMPRLQDFEPWAVIARSASAGR